MAAQRWRLAMYASCGWFWDAPDRIETAGVIRLARQAAALTDEVAGATLGRRLDQDLAELARESISPRPARHGLKGEETFVMWPPLL